MSKEELERVSVQGLLSSVPPRRTSDAPAVLPSTPPSTDEIDTDWGADDSSEAAPDWVADDSNEVTRVMQQPMRVQFSHSPVSEAPTSPAASVAAEVASSSEPRTSPTPWPRPPEAEAEAEAEAGAEREGGIPAMRPQATTLIGLPPPTPPAPPTHEPDSAADEARESTPPAMPSAAFSEPNSFKRRK